MKKYYFSHNVLLLVFILFSLLNVAPAQEIPNGDGDLLWERSIYPRFVNDAKFHPINGNIIAAVNHEIWEIDPKDGHTIRVFEGGVSGREIQEVFITSDGQYLATNIWSTTGIVIWDYNSGNIWKTLKLYGQDLGILPNDHDLIFYYPDGDEICVYNFLTETKVKSHSIIKGSGTNMVDRMALSKDGKYLAIGFAYVLDNNWKYTMELWDAETLTKIRDFGEDNTIGEFKDVQISSNNKYVAFQGGGHFNFFFLSGEKINFNTFNWISFFGFSYDGDKTIIDGDFNNNPSYSAVINNPVDKPIYSFTKTANILRFNKNDEIFSGRITLLFFSNNWYTVGVNENKEINQPIFPNPATEYIEVNVGAIHELPRQEEGVSDAIRIFDIFGDEMHPPRPSGTPQEGNKYRIDVSTLQAGVYFVRIGNEKPMKFMIVR